MKKNWVPERDEMDFNFEDEEVSTRHQKKERAKNIKKCREHKAQRIEEELPIYIYEDDWQ